LRIWEAIGKEAAKNSYEDVRFDSLGVIVATCQGLYCMLIW